VKTKINDILSESSKTINDMIDKCSKPINETAKILSQCILNNGKILICGNGGSAADSQHFAAEIVGRFYFNRQALPAIALTTDSSILTAIANDFGYERVFARQVEALATSLDVVIGITTSGNSKNIIEALIAAKNNKSQTIAMTGANEGLIHKYADLSIKIPSSNTPRIQEGHITAIHILCELIEENCCKRSNKE